MAVKRNTDRQEFWQKTIKRQQDSGQSIMGFCAKEGLCVASFHAWKRRFQQSRRVIRSEPVKQGLVPVQIVSDPAGGVVSLEVQWSGGVVLRAQGCDAQAISAAIATLSASSTQRIL
jgi:hypothetical protein